MKWLQKIVLGVLLLLAIGMIVQSERAEAEQGWPQNNLGLPMNGGSWMGAGYGDNYNETHDNADWIIEGGEDILRSHCSFNLKHDLVIESGGTLRLDSVRFEINTTENNHVILIERGGSLNVTNSTFSIWEVQVFGELYILPGNGSSCVNVISEDASGILIKPESDVEIRESSISGSGDLITVEDPDAIIENCSLSTSSNQRACIILNASAEIQHNYFSEGAPEGSYAIIAHPGAASKVHNNTFEGFKHQSRSQYGRAILSYGPLEIYDNLFTRMAMDNADSDPYVICFVGAEPIDHNGEPVWETNRFRGKTKVPMDERVNIFKQAWTVKVTVNNKDTGNPIRDARVEIRDASEYPVANLMTNEDGDTSFRIPEFYVSAPDDGDEGDSTKNPKNLNPFDIEASKDGQSNGEEDQTIDADTSYILELDLLEFDFGVSDLDLPVQINAGDTIQLDATVFNNGYDRETVVTVEFSITHETLGETLLGNADILMDLDYSHLYFNAEIDPSLASKDVTFRAVTTFPDQNSTNNAFTTLLIHFNQRPAITITEPADGHTFQGSITIRGTASDDVSVSDVELNITGRLDWITVTGTDSWSYQLDSRSLSLENGDYQINVRSKDSNDVFSNTNSIQLTVLNKPTITITSPPDGSVVRGDSTVIMLGSSQKIEAEIASVRVTFEERGPIEGKSSNGSTASYTFQASPVNPDWSQWQLPLQTSTANIINTLADGEHIITAMVTDEDGLSSSTTATYTIHSMNESTNPSVSITTGQFDLISDTWVEGTASDDFRITNVQYSINGGGWKEVTEITNGGTSTVSWRIRLLTTHPDLEIGTNILSVRAFDDDGNSTEDLVINLPVHSQVDLYISNVILQNDQGISLSSSDLQVDSIIRFIVSVEVDGVDTGHPLSFVSVRIVIGGVDGGITHREVVSDSYVETISVKMTNAMVGKRSFTVILDPADIISEIDESNNEFSGELPDQDNGPNPDRTPWEMLMEEKIGPLPIVGVLGIIVALIAVVMVVSRSKRT